MSTSESQIVISNSKAFIYAGVTTEVVAALPQHVTHAGIKAGVTTEVVAALSQHVTHAGIKAGVTQGVVAALPRHMTHALIYPGVTQEVVADLPQHVIQAGIKGCVTREAQDAQQTSNAVQALLDLRRFSQPPPSPLMVTSLPQKELRLMG